MFKTNTVLMAVIYVKLINCKDLIYEKLNSFLRMNNITTNKSTKMQYFEKSKEKKRITHENVITLKIIKNYKIIMEKQRKVTKACFGLLHKTL